MSGKLESIKINGSLCSSAFNDECPFLNRKGTEYGYEHIYWCHKFEVPLQVVVSPSMFPRPVRWVQCFWEIIE